MLAALLVEGGGVPVSHCCVGRPGAVAMRCLAAVE